MIMKKIMFFLSMLFIALISYGQANVGSVTYLNHQLPAAVIELPYPPSVVDAAMADYLSKKGKSRGNDMKGFTTYRNTQPVASDSVNADIYCKTERKSKKEKEVTVVSLLLMPLDEQSSGSNLHYLTMNDAKDYLNGLATAIGAYNLELTIKEQNEAVIKAEAKFKSLTSEGEELEKKRSALEKKIADNKLDQQQQLKEVDNQKQRLTQWVGQRKA
jgi:hypothetical protein